MPHSRTRGDVSHKSILNVTILLFDKFDKVLKRTLEKTCHIIYSNKLISFRIT